MGRIHSIETMGLVDGPGIRVVVFFQGCRLRCAFCHNPDTWTFNQGIEMEPSELLQKILRFKAYFEKSGGGVTCSGGEPLMQPEFLIQFLKLCKENGINTAVDTSGFGKGNYEEILKYTDTLLLDIKHIDKEGYKDLTGGHIEEFYSFLEALNKSSSRIWIRHVMVPGITDSYGAMDKIIDVIIRHISLDKIDNFEILPYHTLGVNKYTKLKIPYKLNNVSSMDKKQAKVFEDYVLKQLRVKN
ncbi:pyruvate formate-lyase-activating protein [Clostridium sp. WILCCON 0269]|uniref:Pyruvate formate-lyase-activating enzyme n=1 Tax=Candidatus Clostridium eludens TaxID=3381663 RepID=A0ABW8SHG6_9CLOT